MIKALYEIMHMKWDYSKKHMAAERVPNSRLFCEKL